MRVKGNEAANGGNGDSRQESETKYLSRWCEMTMDTMRSMNHSLLEMNKSNVTQSLHPGFMTKYGHYLKWRNDMPSPTFQFEDYVKGKVTDSTTGFGIEVSPRVTTSVDISQGEIK